MTQSRPVTYQVTIDDLDLGWEYIPGAMPADESLLEQERARAYAAIAAGVDAQCIPDQKIHVFRGNEQRCVCGKKKEGK